MSERVPSVGRIVHYVAYAALGDQPVCRAAIVTKVDPDATTVSMCVLNPGGMFFNHSVEYDVDATPGTWHWPEMVQKSS